MKEGNECRLRCSLHRSLAPSSAAPSRGAPIDSARLPACPPRLGRVPVSARSTACLDAGSVRHRGEQKQHLALPAPPSSQCHASQSEVDRFESPGTAFNTLNDTCRCRAARRARLRRNRRRSQVLIQGRLVSRHFSLVGSLVRLRRVGEGGSRIVSSSRNASTQRACPPYLLRLLA